MRVVFSLFLLLILFSCGYRFEDKEQTTISVPFIKGDSEGFLINEVVRALSETECFEYRKDDGVLQLIVNVLSDSDDRIGYRYDRKPTTGKRRKNIIGIENRETISVEVTLVDVYTGATIVGPEVISATADYDYVDSNSIKDLTSFVEGKPMTTLDFSLGQLDSIEGAHDDAQIVIFRKLAQNIVDGLSLHKYAQTP